MEENGSENFELQFLKIRKCGLESLQFSGDEMFMPNFSHCSPIVFFPSDTSPFNLKNCFTFSSNYYNLGTKRLKG